MPIACRNKLSFGKTYCVTDCPTRVQPSPLSVLKITAPGDVPPPAPSRPMGLNWFKRGGSAEGLDP